MEGSHTDDAPARGCPFTGAGSALAGKTLADPLIQAHPSEYYRAMRTEDPVHYDAQLGLYLVSRYDDVKSVLNDPATYSSKAGYEAQYAKGYFEEFKEILIREGGGFFFDVIMNDPPEHTRVRRLMQGAVSPRRVATLEPAIRARVVELIESLAAKAENGQVVDGVGEFAVPLTTAIIAEQLGISEIDANKMRRWSLAVVAHISGMQNHEQMLTNARQICELQNFIIARIREREVEPKEDLISDLVHAQTADGNKLDFAEVVSLVRALLIAGNETTTSALSSLLLVLATRPDVAKVLKESADEDRLLSRFVEELLRNEPPVRGLSRMTTREVELGGKVLPKGAHLLVLFGSGCNDDAEFARPEDFDLNRKNLNKHVAFGAGVHNCLGAPLARMEIRVAAREVVHRFDHIKLAVPVESIRYLATVASHSMERLPLIFTRSGASLP
jgi:cytochrome P450